MFTPADTTGFTSASASVALTVQKAAPVLNWAMPAPILYGTALNGTQLNASANVPGTFTYVPGSGSIPATGLQTLSVAFTPNDAADYLSAQATVALTVNAAPAPVPAPAPTPVPVATPAPVAPSANLAILTPSNGAIVSGTITVVGQCLLQLDAAGSHVLVDGVAAPGHLTDKPYLYPLDTTAYANGPHIVQLWAHDTGNNTTVSAPVTVLILN